MSYRSVYQDSIAVVRRFVSTITPPWRIGIAVSLLALLLWWAVGAILLHSGLGELLSNPGIRSPSEQHSKKESATSDDVSSGGTENRPTVGVLEKGVWQTEPVIIDSNAQYIGYTSSPVDEQAATDLLDEGEQAAISEFGNLLSETQGEANREAVEKVEESAAEAASRKMRQALGIEESKPMTRAVDVQLFASADCDVSELEVTSVAVQFRRDSYRPRAISMRQLEILAEAHRKCPEAYIEVSENPLGKTDATEQLTQRRFDEIKYFFIQNSVPKGALRYLDTP